MIHGLLTYWRNSVADEDLLSVDDGEDLFSLPPGAIAGTGALPDHLVAKLRTQWRTIRSQMAGDRTSADMAKPEDIEVVPVLLLTKGLAPRHQHGAIIGNREPKVRFTLLVPAILGRDGMLAPDSGNAPWLVRDFLEPTEDATNDKPIIGAVADFDDWLDRHPFKPADWPALMRWCEDMWSAVTHDSVPDGFVAVADSRVRAAQTSRDMGRHIRRLYDALLQEPNIPPLLTRMCRGAETRRRIGAADRLDQMGAPRGAMGVAYGLADTQALAVVATMRLTDGEALAVNGPPGTGKTTLLQGIIATEVVRRAMAGEAPAIIVGCSTNNQAVTNINRALNDVLVNNRSGERFSWARRWVPDVESYGLCLPVGPKVDEAVAAGFLVAVRDGLDWTRFPERETNPEYVERATTTWWQGFHDTYGAPSQPPPSPEIFDALKCIQADLRQLTAALAQAQEIVQRVTRPEQWWLDLCGPETPPEHHIADRVQVIAAEVDRLAFDLGDRHRALTAIQGKWRAVFTTLDERSVAAADGLATAAAEIDSAMVLAHQLETAAAPQGVIEIMAVYLPFLRGIAAGRQHRRMRSVLGPLERPLFADTWKTEDSAAWIRRADELIATRQAARDAASAQSDAISAARRTAAADRGDEIAAADQAIAAAQGALDAARHAGAQETLALHNHLAGLHSARDDIQGLYDRLCRMAAELAPHSRPPAPDPATRPDWVSPIDELLDVAIRHELFQKAMRYWEGRWIIEAGTLCADPKKARRQGRNDVLARFRRWCMLTPCLVSTLHSLPRHMRFSNFLSIDETTRKKTYASDFLLEGIDLLVMDEAGQVGPHIGMASFALAKRVVGLGDIFQIEPVTKVTRGTDHANAIRAGLAALWQGCDPIAPHLLSESSETGVQGSVMRVLQAATSFTTLDDDDTVHEPGIFLTEHYRCDPAIIAYCNDLAYSGRLQLIRRPGPPAPEMRAWGWAHVRGHCSKRNGSRVNAVEAKAIANWIADRIDGDAGWLTHYRALDPVTFKGEADDLSKIVAVVTPFKSQAAAIRQALKAKGPRFAKLTVGTTHAMQGAERPIIIFSPTYSADPEAPHSMFFDGKPNMLNVAVSRAKDHFVVIGDMRLFRRGRRLPSSLLADRLFASADNEIIDVAIPPDAPSSLLVNAEMVSTLDRHREVLSDAFRAVGKGERLFIVSPYITMRAVEADGIPDRCRNATAQGAEIHVIVDKDEVNREIPRRSPEAIAALQAAGATVHLIPAIHDKILIVADREIVGGSFNWLSAVRDPNLRGCRHETSTRITGDHTAAFITKAIDNMVRLGARL